MDKQRKLDIVDEFDVVVVGGGPAGVSAAISSGREGAKTALVERYGYTGGQATGGLVILIVGLTDGKERIIKGNCEEIIKRLESMGHIQNVGTHILFDPEAMKHLFDSLLIENKVMPFYHSFASDLIFTEESKMFSGVVIDGKSGRRVLKAKVFVDATGDADLAKFADIPYKQLDLNKSLPLTLGFRVGGLDVKKVCEFIAENQDIYRQILDKYNLNIGIGGFIHTTRPNEIWFNIVHAEYVDVTNSDSLTQAEIKCKKDIFNIVNDFKKIILGFEKGYVVDIAQQIGVRDSRHIEGVYKFSEEDIDRNFYDCITKAPNYTGQGQRGYVEFPFRCMISDQAKNIIFAGRCLSIETTPKLIDMFREIPFCISTGQAAGTAAAIAAKASGDVRNININDLRKKLFKHGVKINYSTVRSGN